MILVATSAAFFIQESFVRITSQSNHKGWLLLRLGSDEIGSILFDFLKNLDHSVKHVAFFSDSCGGQKQNRFIASLFRYAIWVLPLETIEIKFLEVGHTQMEVDSMHSIIERAKKNKMIFSPLEWPLIIRGEKRTNPYKVTVLEFDKFHDLKKLKMEFYKR